MKEHGKMSEFEADNSIPKGFKLKGAMFIGMWFIMGYEASSKVFHNLLDNSFYTFAIVFLLLFGSFAIYGFRIVGYISLTILEKYSSPFKVCLTALFLSAYAGMIIFMIKQFLFGF